MATEPPKANIDVGRVISRGFEALKSNFLPFLLIAVLLLGVPGFLSQYFMLSGASNALAAAERGVDIDPYFFLTAAYWGPVAASVLAALLGYTILQVALTRSTILHLSGREADIAGSAMLALRLLLPVIGLTFCVTILLIIGFMLLIVPGIMIWCALIVSVPALVQERAGVFGSMGRSRTLTSGSRWHIFLLVVLIWVFSMIISGATGVISGAGMSFASVGAMPDPILSSAASAIGSVLTGLVGTVIVAALYVELREVKEGASTSVLAEVFG